MGRGPFPLAVLSDNKLLMTATDIARLTPQQRLDLIAKLCDSLTPEDVRLTPAQEAELARRMATFDADRRNAVAWEILDAELDRPAR